MYLQYQREVGDVQSVTNDFRQYSEVFGTICDSDIGIQKMRPSHMVSVSKYCTFCKLCRKVVPGRKMATKYEWYSNSHI